jgi:hypothetical protein
MRSPCLPLDYPLQLDERIDACPFCLPWFVEIVQGDEGLIVREWHAMGCEIWEETPNE